MSEFWSNWIIVLTLIVLIGSVWLLIANRKTEVRGDLPEGEIPKTGHSYDGIEEYENPLPAWWFWMFLSTAAFALIYLMLYPGLGNYKGVLDWTQEKQWQQSIDTASLELDAKYAAYAAISIDDLAADPAALRMGRRLFNNNCAVCHGVGGVGGNGFPNLSDHDWLYGGSGDAIVQSITNGRQGVMPPWGAVLGDRGVEDMADYLMSLNGQPFDAQRAARGAGQYKMFCTGCHGADGSGIQALGAPNLKDRIWLYNQLDTPLLENVRHSIRNGRNGNMPSHADKLRPEKIHLIAAYVYSLSQTSRQR